MKKWRRLFKLHKLNGALILTNPKKEALQNVNPCQYVKNFLTICAVDSFKFPSKNNVVLAAKAVYGNCDFDEGV